MNANSTRGSFSSAVDTPRNSRLIFTTNADKVVGEGEDEAEGEGVLLSVGVRDTVTDRVFVREALSVAVCEAVDV